MTTESNLGLQAVRFIITDTPTITDIPTITIIEDYKYELLYSTFTQYTYESLLNQ